MGVERTGCEVDNREAAQVLGLADQLNGCAQLLGVHIQLILVHGGQLPDGAHHGTCVPHSLNNIASACLALRYIKKRLV